MDENFKSFIKKVQDYNPEEVKIVTNAYEFAKEAHKDQYRKSGEPYIIHPLAVADILADMQGDGDTLCAALLHDVIEDCEVTEEEIEKEFNSDILMLIDGVTKMKNMNYPSVERQDFANTRKIVTGLIKDIRIIIIKLVDRLHNMRTLEFMPEHKQKRISLATMETFVPIAHYIGTYNIKCELEDIAFSYLKSEEYKELLTIRNKFQEEYQSELLKMVNILSNILKEKSINAKFNIRLKNIYGMNKRITSGIKVTDMHDLFAIEILVKDLDSCYVALGIVHQLFHPINRRFKDYICRPKTNMYQSLHTTVIGPLGKLVLIQIRTHEMDRVAALGLPAYWSKLKGEARVFMQQDLKKKYQFYESLAEIQNEFEDDREFIDLLKTEVLSSNVYVYTPAGDTVELPKGSSVIDFAYKVHTDIGNNMDYAIVNGVRVKNSYLVKSKDIIRIVTDKKIKPNKEWLKEAHTFRAQKAIKDKLN